MRSVLAIILGGGQGSRLFPLTQLRSKRPIYTHQRFLPPSRLIECNVHNGLVAEGSSLDNCDVSNTVVGIRTTIRPGARIRKSVLLGADFYEDDPVEASGIVPLGIGPDVLLEQVIVDKNARIGAGARLVNTRGLDEHDGDGYYIRKGIIIVPKDATIPPGFEV